MEAKELLSILLFFEGNIKVIYEQYCNEDIEQKEYKEKSKSYIQKQIGLINQFEKNILTDFMQWLIDEKYCLENPVDDCVNDYIKLTHWVELTDPNKR